MAIDGPMVGWLVAVEGPVLGRVLRVGEPRMLTAEGWFEADPPESDVVVLWWDNGLVVLEDRQAADGAFIEGRKLGRGLPEPLLVGDEFLHAGWRWRVVEMPNGLTPDPDTLRHLPQRTRRDARVAEQVGDGPGGKRGVQRHAVEIPDLLQEALAGLADDDDGGSLLEGRDPWLIGVGGSLAGQSIKLTDGMLLGRLSTCDVVLEHRSVNRKHARVEFNRGRVFLVSMRGGAEPYVNGDRVGGEARALTAGDQIAMGAVHRFRFWLFPAGALPGDEAVARLITAWALERAEWEFQHRQDDAGSRR